MQRALVLDNRSYFAQFGDIAHWLDRWRSVALTLWGGIVFFDLEEIVSWTKGSPYKLRCVSQVCAVARLLRRRFDGRFAVKGAEGRSAD
jgi:hypothetical protein